MGKNYHATKRLNDPDGEPVEVDVELVPLMEALWRLGIETVTCCQDVGESLKPLVPGLPHLAAEADRLRGSAQIDFPMGAGLTFLTAVARAGPRDDFYVRMIHWSAPHAWEVSIRVADRATDEEDQLSEFEIGWLMLVRFPSGDLNEILRRLDAFEKGHVHPPGPIDWSSIELPKGDEVN